jgi:ADP-ribosyl-[dinitrogen reductase] hydrolase
VYGQIGGAFYGVDGIPERWLEQLSMLYEIEELAEGLMDVAKEEAGG